MCCVYVLLIFIEEHCQIQVMRHDELVILRQAPLKRDPFCVQIEAQVRLVRPWKEEPALASVLKAIMMGAHMSVWQPHLNGPCQAGDAQLLHVIPAPAAPASSPHIRTDHLCCYGAYLRVLVNVILLLLLERLDRLIQRALAWVYAGDCPL